MTDNDRVRETAWEYVPPHLRLTYEDYCRIPDGRRYELVEGSLRMTPSPGVFHQKVSGRIEKALRQWVEERDLGEVYYAPLDVVLSEYNVVQPDILFVAKDRLGIIKETHIRGAPDLVVEIFSPGNSDWDRIVKRRLYSRHGVREMWLVDLEARSIEVAVYRRKNLVTIQVYPSGGTLTSPLLPGFSLEVDTIFQP